MPEELVEVRMSPIIHVVSYLYVHDLIVCIITLLGQQSNVSTSDFERSK